MILIFCFQNNKHWHENEPQAATSNEKMKLVFQLTDQKHFIHYNQAFIWLDLFCVHAQARVYCSVCVCLCVHEAYVCTCKYIIHVSVCYYATACYCYHDAAYDIFQPFVPELAGWLSHYMQFYASSFTIASIISHKLHQLNNQLQLDLLLHGLGWEAGMFSSL